MPFFMLVFEAVVLAFCHKSSMGFYGKGMSEMIAVKFTCLSKGASCYTAGVKITPSCSAGLPSLRACGSANVDVTLHKTGERIRKL
jgi:hypothetical protein